jgi:hypothetical protein
LFSDSLQLKTAPNSHSNSILELKRLICHEPKTKIESPLLNAYSSLFSVWQQQKRFITRQLFNVEAKYS